MIYNYTIQPDGMETCGPAYLTHTTQFSYYQVAQMVHELYKEIDRNGKSHLSVWIQLLELMRKRHGFESIVSECSFYVRLIDIEIAGLSDGVSE